MKYSCRWLGPTHKSVTQSQIAGLNYPCFLPPYYWSLFHLVWVRGHYRVIVPYTIEVENMAICSTFVFHTLSRCIGLPIWVFYTPKKGQTLQYNVHWLKMREIYGHCHKLRPSSQPAEMMILSNLGAGIQLQIFGFQDSSRSRREMAGWNLCRTSIYWLLRCYIWALSSRQCSSQWPTRCLPPNIFSIPKA
jgi:hypothetical protein